ncbi:MAG TPA: hypothetical protein VGB43_07410, partial [Flavobacterium sp.]
RKITSLILDCEKCGVAKTNYLVKRRNIKFVESFKDIEIKQDVLLLTSSGLTEYFDELLKTVQTVMVIRNEEYKELILQGGFVKAFDDSGLVIYKKK